jgi:hypothetical protein
VRAVANVQLNDRQVAIVQARSNGFVERSTHVLLATSLHAACPWWTCSFRNGLAPKRNFWRCSVRRTWR